MGAMRKLIISMMLVFGAGAIHELAAPESAGAGSGCLDCSYTDRWCCVTTGGRAGYKSCSGMIDTAMRQCLSCQVWGECDQIITRR